MEPSQVASLIQTTLVPVIMISAVGLVALVVQNRHAVVLERTFRINARRLELWEELRELDATSPTARVRWLRGQLDIQEHLLGRWLSRGTYTRNALVGAFLGVTLFGLTSFDLVINVLLGLSGAWAQLTVALFLAGIVSFISCFIYALLDVYQGLWITRMDTRMVNDLMLQLGRGEGERPGEERAA
jgi:hypothetical protein